MVGSFPKPAWFTESLRGRPFKIAMGDSLYREQYVDAVACYVNEQERAGLDILTDGDTRFDLEVGGRSWFFYVIERLGGISGAIATPRISWNMPTSSPVISSMRSRRRIIRRP